MENSKPLRAKADGVARGSEGDMSIGSKIKDLCSDNDISVRELSKRVGVADTSLYNYTNDRSYPNAQVLYEIAQYFGVTMESFWK